jgi:hypothetical protein
VSCDAPLAGPYCSRCGERTLDSKEARIIPGTEQQDLGDPTDGGQRVSAVPGNQPLWSRDGKELYYLSREGQLLALPVDTTGPTFSAGKPTSLFGPPYDFSSVNSSDGTYTHVYYDVDAAGRFVVMRPEVAEPSHMIVVQNWFEELRQRGPVE